MTVPIERALAVWPVLAAQAIIFGTAAFVLTMARRRECEPMRLAESLTPWWRAWALIAFVFAPVVLLVGASAMSGMPIPRAAPFVGEVLRQTHFGRVWVYRFGSIVALVIAAWIPLRQMTRTILMCAVAGLSWVLTSFASHAIDHGPRAVAIYFIHVMAASAWLGAVLSLWIGATRGRLGTEWVANASLRVSSVAAWAVLAIVGSGVYTAYLALDGDPSRLLYSAYGRVLTIKVAIAAAVLMIGGYNRFFIIPAIAKTSARVALIWNVGIEAAMLIGVFGLAALLANTPPAH